MSDLSESQARDILDRVIRLSRADTCQVGIGGGVGGNMRCARNSVSTAGETSNRSLNVSASFGKRTGSASGNEFDDAALERVVRRAEELARLAPENPEWIEPLGPQTYLKTPGYYESTARIDPGYRAGVAADCILPARPRGAGGGGLRRGGTRWAGVLGVVRL